MADVLFVFVREDAARAQALAALFAAAGHEIGDGLIDNAALELCGAGVVLWSRAAINSQAFLATAQRVLDSGKGVVASLGQPPPAWVVGHAPTYDLSQWRGDPGEDLLDALFMAVDYRVTANRDDLAADEDLAPHLAGWTADLPTAPSGAGAPEPKARAPSEVLPLDRIRQRRS
ncbi:MAG: hypothetical protein JSS00_06385 [Proteobacteria bacterium]|nr:hypothetical protein [Pseudomonadota bacterium]